MEGLGYSACARNQREAVRHQRIGVIWGTQRGRPLRGNTKSIEWKEIKVSKKMKSVRRFIKRISDRKGIDYRAAIESFYGKKISELDRNLVIALMSEGPSSRIL